MPKKPYIQRITKPTDVKHRRTVVSSKKRPRPLKARTIRPTTSIFLTGGIGDVLAIESFLNDTDRQNVDTIFYATNKRLYIQEIFTSLTNFPNLKNHVNLWDDFSKFWCFYSLEDYIRKARDWDVCFDKNVRLSKDLSISKVFDEIKKGNIKYTYSSVLQQKLADSSKFNLPESFVVILPCSTDKRIKQRDFNSFDWQETLKILRKNNLHGIILNTEMEEVPANDLLIDLSQKTTIAESIEILKSAKGYLGIDSWMSVLAAKLFETPNIQIKSHNSHCYDNAMCYYAPKENFDFIVKQIFSY